MWKKNAFHKEKNGFLLQNRFAIEYHRKLREEKAFHSVLDDIANIGKVRKKALLQKFGTIEAIAKAEVEELLTVPQMTI